MKKRDIFIGLGLALFLAAFSFFAASSPDGLKKVAQSKSFLSREITLIKSPLAGYLFPQISNKKLATSLAAVLGVGIVFLLAIGLARLIRKKP